jgi:membrane-bound ClpP family serine protease
MKSAVEQLSKEAEATERVIELTYKEIHELNNLIRSAALARARVKELYRLLNHKELEYSQIMDQIREAQLEDLVKTVAPVGVVIVKGGVKG